MTQYIWEAGRFQIDLSKPKVMGIINLTPDSFSDGGKYSKSVADALAHAEKLLSEGAHILDIGGESTRPGSGYISPEDEWSRVEPVLEKLASWNVPLSLDTRRAEIMRKTLAAGYADIINDVQALEDQGSADVLAQYPRIGICLMHMQGMPETMQDDPRYQDVVAEVTDYLKARVAACVQAGINESRIVLDPGFGFGKTLKHNLLLMQHLDKLAESVGLPLLAGVSRKRMIGDLTGEQKPDRRIYGSVAAALAAVSRGARIIRVHDVKATVDALNVWRELGVFPAN